MGVSTKLGKMCLAKGLKPVKIEPAGPRSRVKHSTTEPLRCRNHGCEDPFGIMRIAEG